MQDHMDLSVAHWRHSGTPNKAKIASETIQTELLTLVQRTENKTIMSKFYFPTETIHFKRKPQICSGKIKILTSFTSGSINK